MTLQRAPAAAVIAAALLSGFTFRGDDFFFRLNKGIDIYGRVYREVATAYVDEIDPIVLMESGIDGMLGSLDPYTSFINDEEGDEVELVTSGRYGGIGVTVGTRDGQVTILSVMDGYSAQKQGLLPGDRIVRVDDREIAAMKTSEVRVLTRGTPGTEVRVMIERDGEAAPLEFILVREEIRLRNVSYSGMIADGVGYIRLERFSRDAGDEVALALKEFRLRGAMRGVILDVRNNPGGLLDAAVDVVGKFLPRGSLIVSTRGRKAESERKYFTMSDPLVPDLPLVVLINNASASASEIVAAAVQDLDRGVILGSRSFGKGLVQTVVPLVYNTQLKITTARYYTPSGRSLQEIDYSHGSATGGAGTAAAAKDTAAPKRKFLTSKGRPEEANGGVAPDTVVETPPPGAVMEALLRKSMFFRFAAKHRRDLSGPPERPDSLMAKFVRYLDTQEFDYDDPAAGLLGESAALVRSSGADTAIAGEIDALRRKLEGRARKSVDSHRDEIVAAIEAELRGMDGGEGARIAAGLPRDAQVRAAVGMLLDRAEYDRRLTFGTGVEEKENR